MDLSMRAIRIEWIVVGGFCITVLAAALNITFLIYFGTSVSHLTGDLSKFSLDLARSGSSILLASHLSLAILGFLTGAIISGFFIHHPKLDLEKPYGRSISSIGLILLLSYACIDTVALLSIFLASLACGFQNALASRFHGMVLRTTHITGLLTDLGICMGMRLKKHKIDEWKIWLPAILVFGFFVGSLIGAVGSFLWGKTTLLYIAIAYIAGGLGWSIFKHNFLVPNTHNDQS